jgi:hypothetical protein
MIYCGISLAPHLKLPRWGSSASNHEEGERSLLDPELTPKSLAQWIRYDAKRE